MKKYSYETNLNQKIPFLIFDCFKILCIFVRIKDTAKSNKGKLFKIKKNTT